MSKFQLIFISLLVALAIGGAILFATSKRTASDVAVKTVMWGTLDQATMTNFLYEVTLDDRSAINVDYVEKEPKTFESELISALARGAGPDMVILPQDLIVKQFDKYYVIPFTSYPERTFKDSFVQQGEMFLVPPKEDFVGGVVGLPFSIDPMVMYWNRDMFTNEELINPPTTWTEFYSLVPKLTKKDQNGNIAQSLVAFGEMRNVTHPKDILALLTMQAGNPIVGRDPLGFFKSVFADRAQALSPAEEAVSYFTGFSDPVKVTYSWNRSLPNDRQSFIGGKLAVYFGYASELASIRNANPNLNFDVARVPQAIGKKMTFGRMNAIVLLKTSQNINAAFIAANALTSSAVGAKWVEKSGLPPARRDLLSQLPTDAYKTVFYQSALISNAWLDPDKDATNGVFTRLIENVTSGKMRVSESVRSASLEIGQLLPLNTGI